MRDSIIAFVLAALCLWAAYALRGTQPHTAPHEQRSGHAGTDVGR